MRSEKNPLDLNNLPEDYSRDGKQIGEDSSSSGNRKKKMGQKEGKDENGKVYECRFCSLKFCKSQALGGHMNRHRQERETETLNRARQLVFSNDNIVPQGPSHLDNCQGVTPGYYGDPTLAFRSVYPSRLIPGSSSTIQPPPPPLQPPQSYVYASPSSRLVSYPSTHHMKDCYVGHIINNNSSSDSGVFTCIGAPVIGHGPGHGRGESDNRDISLQNQVNWGRSYAGTSQQHLDHPSINRYQDGF